jgi:arginyl-tRNA synthetase
MREFSEIYEEMGVKFDENEGRGYGESFFRDKTEKVIKELEEKKLLKTSRGAKIVEFDKKLKLPPLMIVKQDGATLYATRDLATDKWRLEQYGAGTMIINEVGKEQGLYFKQIYKLEEMLGWVKAGQRKHIGHGLYCFSGRKMSTRKGEVVWLSQIVEEVRQKVRAMSKETLDEDDVRIVTWGAIKWNDLIREPLGDIDFNLQAMLRLNGNSGAYMQYTAVRIQSILQKAQKGEIKSVGLKDLVSREKIVEEMEVVMKDEREWQKEELEIVGKVNEYEKIKKRATENLAPHILANYLFELAQVMNNFYAQKEILGNRRRELLTQVVGMVLNDGFIILGIQIPSKM